MRRVYHRARGQILVLMALLSTTLIIFFGMVVSIGHLVQARINLQNAVDFAAMVGASHQASHLNAISMINYRMRQNYKFLLADLYVTQSRFNQGFRDAIAGGGGPRAKIADGDVGNVFGICQQYPGYKPNVEIGYGASDRAFPDSDLCKFVGTGTGIPHPIIVPVLWPDPIALTMFFLNVKIAQELKDTCEDAKGQNYAYFEYMMDKYLERNASQEDALNRAVAAFSAAFSRTSAVEELGNTNAEMAMRATVYDNLISANKANNSLSIQYLNPQSTRSPEASLAANIDTYFDWQVSRVQISYVDFKNQGGECVPDPGLAMSPQLKLGVNRSRTATSSAGFYGGNAHPKVPIHVVIKASVQPKLLFWPQSLTPRLHAIGAAKPFGSRIGPPKEVSNLELTGNASGVSNGNFANINFYPGDTRGGFKHIRILKELYDAHGAANTTGDPMMRPKAAMCGPGVREFACLALAPTLFEGLMWTIFPDPPGIFARGPAEFASYPHDIVGLLALGGVGGYELPDRGSAAGAMGWHFVNTNLGQDGRYRDSNKPLFYSDHTSVASAFNPQINPVTQTEIHGYLASGQTAGRTGYQVKLVSIKQLCRELAQGDSGAIGPRPGLEPYCAGTSKLLY